MTPGLLFEVSGCYRTQRQILPDQLAGGLDLTRHARPNGVVQVLTLYSTPEPSRYRHPRRGDVSAPHRRRRRLGRGRRHRRPSPPLADRSARDRRGARPSRRPHRLDHAGPPARVIQIARPPARPPRRLPSCAAAAPPGRDTVVVDSPRRAATSERPAKHHESPRLSLSP